MKERRRTRPESGAQAGGRCRILRRPAVEGLVGLKRSAIYAAVAEGTFPRPVSLGRHAVGWLEDELQAWIADRIAVRDGQAPGEAEDP